MAIALNRRFVECDDEKADPDLVAHFGRTEATRGWDDLLNLRRVVILAEAGSGKTTEMTTRAREQLNAGHPSFYATLEDVGRSELEAALHPADRPRLAVWLASEQDGWFFIDSVDEAKHAGIKLRTALRAIAAAIAGAERRAHVVLSGRYTDWQFRQDLAQLNQELPIPADQALPAPPTPDELVVSTIHRERPKPPPPPPEKATVVVMTGLDAERVRLFAKGKNVQNVDAFISQIEAGNLWQFARRPLDLDWLVEFWHNHSRLGSLAETLEVCLAERLQESNLDRTRQNSLDVARAMHAIERIGAALVFGRKSTIRVPDAEIRLSADPSSLDIADVLPDWSPQDRSLLLVRAVFDPATLGRARFHNDNQGVVRAHLAARWLQRLRQSNVSQQGLFDLLFAETYGVEVIKPSMQETAAWLSLWDENVAKEVARRQPFLLLTASDPASLLRHTRESLLNLVVEKIASGERVPLLDFDTFKRFCRPDLAQTVRELWGVHSAHAEVRWFLLRVISGGIRECADLAHEVVFGPKPDRRISIVAGRALMAAGDEATKARYGAFIKANCANLPNTVVWDALEPLFPRHLGIDDLLHVLSRIDVTDSDGGLGLDWHGPKLIERLTSQAELEGLVDALLTQLGGSISAGEREETGREKVYFPMIAAAADRILELCPIDQAPIPAIDAAARLGKSIRTSRSARKVAGDVTTELQKTPARRRLAFWRFVECLAGHPMLGGRDIESLWDLQYLGWSVKLSVEDIDWLLADGLERVPDHERRLAINTAMAMWRSAGSSDDLRERIRARVKTDAVMAQAFDSWLKPPQRSAEETESRKELERLVRRNAVERAKTDKSWVDFAAKLRDNPEEMRNLTATTAKGADARLFDLWHLLNQIEEVDRKYAIDSVAPLEPMIGPQAAEAVRVGLIAHWRAWEPWLRSTRKDEELGQVRFLDCMGIAGVTLEAKARPEWATQFSSDDARRAANYATLELNGFPAWLAALAEAKPDEVRAVLSTEIIAELNRRSDAPRFGVLQDIARGDRSIAELMAPAVLDELEKRTALPTDVLSQVLDVAKRGLPPEQDRLKSLAITRFNNATDPAISSLYISAVFSIDGTAATDAVFARIDQMPAAYQPGLVQVVLPHIFRDRYEDEEPPFRNLPPSSLERLVRLAFQTIRIEDDNVHPSGVVYSLDNRDNAEQARGAALELLVNTPGRATYDAILRLADSSDFAVLKPRLIELAKERAAKDSESGSWKAREAAAFEESAETEPHTSRDLQLVALRRLTDMQYDLIHDDFQQGETLAGLAGENAVQRWVADRMRLKQGRSYSVEREVHVADEKEPDMRLRAKAGDASVPVEVKVVESWSLDELEAALRDQLCGKYLRARESRHGILLLVHQKARPKGWKGPHGALLTFDQVVSHLRAMAVAIAAFSSDAPQPEVAVLDVSRFNESEAMNANKGQMA